jgi:uncharacterized membrane protein
MDKGGAIFALLSVFTVMLGSWFFAGMHVSMTTEEVEYRVLHELEGNVEVREYDEMTIASASSNDIDEVFSTLTSYISGNNAEKKKIEMIYPLIAFEDENIVNMSFILPETYNVNNTPAPVHPEITIRSIPAGKVAAIQFSGYAKGEILDTKRSVLSLELDEKNITSKGDFFLICYNPPWIPPALMRNEIAIEVE